MEFPNRWPDTWEAQAMNLHLLLVSTADAYLFVSSRASCLLITNYVLCRGIELIGEQRMRLWWWWQRFRVHPRCGFWLIYFKSSFFVHISPSLSASSNSDGPWHLAGGLGIECDPGGEVAVVYGKRGVRYLAIYLTFTYYFTCVYK